jgi:plasmid stability protein
MLKKIDVRLPKELKAAAKTRAAEEGRSLSSLAVEALQKVLSEPSRRKPDGHPPDRGRHKMSRLRRD